jgi:hypothetical protein
MESGMKLRLMALAGALVTMAGLSACAVDEAYYGPPPPYADVDYDGYYDGSYGPFNGGYWGPNDQFYYWSQDHMHYHRDVGGHFSRQGRSGFNPIRGHAPAAGGQRRP